MYHWHLTLTFRQLALHLQHHTDKVHMHVFLPTSNDHQSLGVTSALHTTIAAKYRTPPAERCANTFPATETFIFQTMLHEIMRDDCKSFNNPLTTTC
jgi:hypothetical protein